LTGLGANTIESRGQVALPHVRPRGGQLRRGPVVSGGESHDIAAENFGPYRTLVSGVIGQANESSTRQLSSSASARMIPLGPRR
jgi:hypothetical protein